MLGRHDRDDTRSWRRHVADDSILRALRQRFVQQVINRANGRNGMKALHQRVVVQGVCNGRQNHALVVCHERLHDARFGFRRMILTVIQRFVEAVSTPAANGLQFFKIIDHGGRIERQREHAGIRRDDVSIARRPAQRQRVDAKRVILEVPGRVQFEIRRFRQAPGGFAAAGQFALFANHGSAA